MARSVGGVVKGGVVVPNHPLPEGAWVEIVLPESMTEVPLELADEWEAWDRASAEALELVERLAQEKAPDEKG
jgi:hypothetical protein